MEASHVAGAGVAPAGVAATGDGGTGGMAAVVCAWATTPSGVMPSSLVAAGSAPPAVVYSGRAGAAGVAAMGVDMLPLQLLTGVDTSSNSSAVSNGVAATGVAVGGVAAMTVLSTCVGASTPRPNTRRSLSRAVSAATTAS